METNQWIRRMAKGGRVKEMESALGVMQGDCRDAAASLPQRPGANVFVFAVARVHFVCRRNSRKSGW